jgi:hypothetical protein
MLITVLGVPMNGWAALSLAIQFLLPLLVGFVTTKETNRERQFLLLAGLTLLATVGTQVLQDHDAGVALNLVQIVVTAVVNFGVSILSHYGIWKPTNLAELALAVFRTPGPVGPAPLDPAPASSEAALPARHLYVLPGVAESPFAAGELPLEPVQKDVA